CDGTSSATSCSSGCSSGCGTPSPWQRGGVRPRFPRRPAGSPGRWHRERAADTPLCGGGGPDPGGLGVRAGGVCHRLDGNDALRDLPLGALATGRAPMNSARRNRLLAVVALLCAGTALAFVAFGNMGKNLVFYWTPGEMLAQGSKAYGPTIRLGGVVQ